MIPRYEVLRGKPPLDCVWYWHLKGANGEIQCHSEAYTRQEDAVRGAKDARWSAMKAWLQPIKLLS